MAITKPVLYSVFISFLLILNIVSAETPPAHGAIDENAPPAVVPPKIPKPTVDKTHFRSGTIKKEPLPGIKRADIKLGSQVVAPSKPTK